MGATVGPIKSPRIGWRICTLTFSSRLLNLPFSGSRDGAQRRSRDSAATDGSRASAWGVGLGHICSRGAGAGVRISDPMIFRLSNRVFGVSILLTFAPHLVGVDQVFHRAHVLWF